MYTLRTFRGYLTNVESLKVADEVARGLICEISEDGFGKEMMWVEIESESTHKKRLVYCIDEEFPTILKYTPWMSEL